MPVATPTIDRLNQDNPGLKDRLVDNIGRAVGILEANAAGRGLPQEVLSHRFRLRADAEGNRPTGNFRMTHAQLVDIARMERAAFIADPANENGTPPTAAQLNDRVMGFIERVEARASAERAAAPAEGRPDSQGNVGTAFAEEYTTLRTQYMMGTPAVPAMGGAPARPAVPATRNSLPTAERADVPEIAPVSPRITALDQARDAVASLNIGGAVNTSGPNGTAVITGSIPGASKREV